MTTIIYKTAGAWGPGVGRTLVAAEVDGNFWSHDQAITALQALPLGVGISTIVQTAANQLTITLTDARTYVFTLPTLQYTYRGDWQPSTYYNVFDLVSVPSEAAIYQVIFAHNSAQVFNPLAGDGAGHLYYQLFLQTPNSLPAGGTTSQVLAKNSNSDYDTIWLSGLPPVGGVTGAALFKNSTTNYDMLWRPINFVDVTGNPSTAQLRTTVNNVLTPDVFGNTSLNPVLGNIFTLTPVASTTINASSAPNDARIVIFVIAGSTSYNITFGSLFKGAGVLATGTTAGVRFCVSFAGDGTFLTEMSRSGPFS